LEKKNLICIACPLGCALVIVVENSAVLSVTGQKCPRGEHYAIKEITNPTRIVTTTVTLIGGDIERLPVKTESEIPKDKIYDCVRALKGIAVKTPVYVGDVIVENIVDTGVDIVATNTKRTRTSG